ncbi:MAG: hypothetical protein J6R68_06490 [Clostridia bacterium]|nr:hypothetical protein [Clostridia bacterium]
MPKNNKIEYCELSKAKITDSRNIVISRCSKGGFTVAQQLEAKENDKVTTVFMKGAFHVDDVHGLYNLRDAINLAIKMVEESTEDTEWDDTAFSE